jgi:hypothetical protein
VREYGVWIERATGDGIIRFRSEKGKRKKAAAGRFDTLPFG